MKMTKEELKAKLDAHALWLKTWFTDNVQGECADLSYADLTDANLTRADLTDADLTDANLTDANLTGANLTGADLTGADLSRANLTYADLTDANLTDANLWGANLYVNEASPFVYDAIAAAVNLQMALKKTRIEWEKSKRSEDERD